MGANQSYDQAFGGDVTSGLHAADRKDRNLDEGSLQKRRKKAKPASPHRPSITSVTHNAISLAWLPPRHSLHAIIAYTVEVRRPQQHTKSWTILTKNCQGTHYDARHLDSDTEYVFRVRAENIFGTGKPSAPSGLVTTKVFESSSDLNCYISPTSHSGVSPISPFIERRPGSTSSPSSNFPKSISYDTGLLEASSDSTFNTSVDSGLVKSPSLPVDSPNSSLRALNTSDLNIDQSQQYQSGNFKRRHSFNVHLDGRISTMLNHSDRFYSTNSLNSSTSTIVMHKTSSNNNNGSVNNIYNNNHHNHNINDTDSAKTRHSSTSSILRHNAHRTSLQPYRKSTIPILLPGTASNSLNKLRESRVSLKSNSGSTNDISANSCSTGNASSSTITANHHLASTPRHRGSLNSNSNARKSRECRNSLGSTASDSNTTTSSSSASSTSAKEDYTGAKVGEGSRLSLQSVFSDVTMSTHSQTSSDDSSSSPSRPISSFSDIGDLTTELGSFLNGSSFIDALRITTSATSSLERDTRSPLDNEQTPKKDDYYDNKSINTLEEEADDIYRLKNDLKNMEITEETLKFHDLKERMKSGGGVVSSGESCLINGNVNQKDYYQTLDNPWERDSESVSRVSENIMAAPFSDDIKMALNAGNGYSSDDANANGNFHHYLHHHHHHHHHLHNRNSWGEDGEGQERDDFRTLRSVLQSNNMIVKQSRSMPEVVGVVLGEGGETRTLTRGTLTTIEDEEEEEEEAAVRITTL